MAQVFLVDSFTSVAYQGNQSVVILLDKINEVNDDRKKKLAGEFFVSTAFPQPLDTDDFLTATKFKLDVFTQSAQLPLCESATLAAAHVLNLKNPSEEFEFETGIGTLKTRAEKHDLTTLILPLLEILSLDSHKQGLTEKLKTTPDPDGIGLRIAGLLPAGTMVSQLVYCPQLKYLLIALDQATTHEQFMSLNLPHEQLLALDPEGQNVRGVIVTFHYIPTSTTEDVQSVQQLLPFLSEPDYVVRVFESWHDVDEGRTFGSAQIVAAPFWSSTYNRTNLRACQFHPKRAAEFRIEMRDGKVEVSGQAVLVFSGYIADPALSH